MGSFAADLAEVLFAQAASDPEAAAAHGLVAELVAADPSLIDHVPHNVVLQFVSEGGADTAAAAVVARSVSLPAETLIAFLLRSDLSLSDIEPFVSPDTAYVLASRSDRPDVLGLLFTNPETLSNDAVLAALLANAASPPELRVQVAVERIHRSPEAYTRLMGGPYGWIRSMSEALRRHPEMQQSVFDALNLSDGQLLQLFWELSSWNALTVSQLDRLVTAFEQDLAGLGRDASDSQHLERAPTRALVLLQHPAATRALQDRVLAALPDGTPPELSPAVGVLTATDRIGALLAAEVMNQGSNLTVRSVIESSTTAELVDALATLRGSAKPLPRLAIMIVSWLPYSRYTTELVTALPCTAFRTWVTCDPLSDHPPPPALYELLGSRLGTDPSAWRMFAELAAAADAEATAGDVADLAASLTADQ